MTQACYSACRLFADASGNYPPHYLDFSKAWNI